MHTSTLVALLTAGLVGLVHSQTIDPSTVDDSTKSKWCLDQKSSCPLLCLQIPGATGPPEENSCTSSTLDYSCVCSNGQQPNASEYSQTIPYYECTTAATDCVNNCNTADSSCQSACRTDHPCGAQDPKRVNTSTISSTMAATSSGASATADSTATGVYTGFGSSSKATGTSAAVHQAQALALGFGRVYGLVVVLACVCGGFMLML